MEQMKLKEKKSCIHVKKLWRSCTLQFYVLPFQSRPLYPVFHPILALSCDFIATSIQPKDS